MRRYRWFGVVIDLVIEVETNTPQQWDYITEILVEEQPIGAYRDDGGT
jgi:hypothetical protein